MRGRRPESDGLQELKGDSAKRKRRKGVVEVLDAEPLPDGTPSHLSEFARAFYRKVAPELVRLNFVRMTDRTILERYCEALAEFWKMNTSLRGKPRTYWTDTLHGKMKRIEPTFLLMQRQEKLLFDYEDRIGLNPQARQRILLNMAATQGVLPLDTREKSIDGSAASQGSGGGSAPGHKRVGFLNTSGDPVH